MATFRTNWRGEIPRMRQRVRIDGSTRPDVFAIAVSYGMGLQGSTATLAVPRALWDEDKSQFLKRKVIVHAGPGRLGSDPVFVGYIPESTGTLSLDDNTLAVNAVSTIALAHGVYLGQAPIEIGQEEYARGPEFFYPERAMLRGVMTRTGWNAKSVLRDWFSVSQVTWRGGGANLPGDWRQELRLGSMSVLRGAYDEVSLGDLTYFQTSLADALAELLQRLAGISFRERFTSTATYLDFFEIADPSAPVKPVRVAVLGEDIVTSGANVAEVEHSSNVDEVRPRLIGAGARRKYVVTITSDHETAPLEKGWAEGVTTPPSLYSDLELTVLGNPEAVKPYAESGVAGDESRGEWNQELAYVFTRWKLPDWVRRAVIEDKNALTLSDGSSLPIQVFKWPRVLQVDPEGGENDWTSSPSETPKLLSNVEFDFESGWMLLREPAINFVASRTLEDGTVEDEYEPARIGITLTVAGRRLLHDTRDRAGGLSIGPSIPTEWITNESFGFVQVTNTGAPFADSDNIEHEYLEAWFYVPDQGWTHAESPLILQDDELALRQNTELAALERNRERQNYTITIPWMTTGYRLGDRIRVIGQNDFDRGVHQVQSVNMVLAADHSTVISTDNLAPLLLSNLGDPGTVDSAMGQQAAAAGPTPEMAQRTGDVLGGALAAGLGGLFDRTRAARLGPNAMRGARALADRIPDMPLDNAPSSERAFKRIFGGGG